MESADRPVLRSRVWLVAAGVIAALIAVLASVGLDQPAAFAALGLSAAIVVAVIVWASLRARRQRRAYEDDLTAWAAERAAHAERLRIARDLHDLASHGLGLITVRAAAARRVAGPDGDVERATALADIERAGRDATAELRRMLAVLRAPGEDAPLRPAETLDDLPGILAAARTAGVDATLEPGELGEVPAGVQLAVCTVVREALANAARHAGPCRARVGVRREGSTIVVAVDDDGPTPGWQPHRGAGAGLVGLRERVEALGGELDAGAAGRGFRLVARMPGER